MYLKQELTDPLCCELGQLVAVLCIFLGAMWVFIPSFVGHTKLST